MSGYVPNPDELFHFGEPAPDLHDKLEWRTWCTAERDPTTRPRRLTRRQLRALDDALRRAYDLDRVRHYASFHPLVTPPMAHAFDQLDRLVRINLASDLPGARLGAMLDGTGTLGKSTILREYARRHELRMRRLASHGQVILDDFVPVVLIDTPRSGSSKTFCKLIADFFHCPYTRHTSEDALMATVERAMRRCRTTLLGIDDFHFLDPYDRHHDKLSKLLKTLTNNLPITLVVTGIGLEHSGLLQRRTPRRPPKPLPDTRPHCAPADRAVLKRRRRLTA